MVTKKKTDKPKTTDPITPENSKEDKLEQIRAAAKLKSVTNHPYYTQPKVNYNLEWAKAKAVVRQADEARLARQAQNAANQKAYNQSLRVAQTGFARGDALSGRTPEGGTRSLLESLRNWIGGGPGKRTK